VVQSRGSWTSRRVCSFAESLRTLQEGCSEISGVGMCRVDGSESGVGEGHDAVGVGD
jgi:hypothetical protein